MTRSTSGDRSQQGDGLYHGIVSAMDAGVMLLDVQFDDEGRAVDAIVLDANPAQHAIDGNGTLAGKRLREIRPDTRWIDRCEEAARTGATAHFEDWSERSQKWYAIDATRVGGPGSSHVAVVSHDVTVRKAVDHELTRTRDALARAEQTLRWREQWFIAQRDAFQATADGAPLNVSLGVLVKTAVAQSGKGLQCAFYLTDASRADLRHVTGMSDSYARPADDFKIDPDSLACWFFPLETLHGGVIGTLAMDFRAPREPTALDYDNAAVMTRAAAIIIARTHEADDRSRAESTLRDSEERLRGLNELLERRVRERTAEINTLFTRLLSVQENERSRIARDIHDQLGQQVTALRMNIEALRMKAGGSADVLEHAMRAERLAADFDQTIDFLIRELRPAALDHLGLSDALRTLVSEWSHRFGIVADYEIAGHNGSRLPLEIETNLYRIAQEALHNVAKHAHATQVTVFLERPGEQTVMVIEDNGRGFNPTQVQTGRAGLGLVSMRERAMSIGGQLEIESAAGSGTSIFVRVPERSRPA